MDANEESAYRSISEAAAALDLPPHVLRFWETKFKEIKPLKRGGGRRYYRAEDMRLLEHIKLLLHERGMTIKGVQQLIKTNGAKGLEAHLAPKQNDPQNSHDTFVKLRARLVEIRQMLE